MKEGCYIHLINTHKGKEEKERRERKGDIKRGTKKEKGRERQWRRD